MEDFSQSRGDDDLFDDEIIPYENTPSETIASQLERVSLEPTSTYPPVEAVSAAIPAPPATRAPIPSSTDSSYPSSRSRTRGRSGQQTGRGGATRAVPTGLEDSKWASKPADSSKPAARASKPVKAPEQEPQQPSITPPEIAPPVTSTEQESGQPGEDTSAADIQPPTGPATTVPATTVPPKTPAVRGDRTLTGGLARTKLTEEELSAKLAAAKERSQNLAAAHARAQADAASFEERERVAGQKRAVEKKERRALEGEREKNRLRKLGNREGREWDRDKEDVLAGMNGGGTRGRRGYAEYGGRRFSGGQGKEDDLRQYEWHDERGRGGGRGRGGRGDRGRGRGRGGPRGGFGQDAQSQHQPDISADIDFPSLPGSSADSPVTKKDLFEMKTGTKDTKPAPLRNDSIGAGGGGTWADQVESSELNTS